MSSQYLPLSLAPEDKGKDDSVKKDKPYKIFFKDLFLFKENEMAAKKKEKFINRSMKVYQKSTFSSRMKSRSHLGQVAFYSDTAGGSFEKFGLDPTLILRLTEGADTKRTIHEFINDQRDRFLLEVVKIIFLPLVKQKTSGRALPKFHLGSLFFHYMLQIYCPSDPFLNNLSWASVLIIPPKLLLPRFSVTFPSPSSNCHLTGFLFLPFSSS
ncbi:coiled-coil domain-containing protein 38 isoform X3 [Ursus arctos]|uniref:coiled-coil domain-containing protein 38 isoform X3 n=1 Tax=Ursus arctos TaxID=9644 RepID=UPI001CF91FDC|nr:coiled-coil domain-containing protein 38 isoform X3 [Ursus arctos]XP_057172278.1 coiled-coil domain-containing protein 38 isoform X3 [Ursus arctos]XP_057172279.1 coiled-coil domain-containing protein 38 isoform X3 [Ursus arctos]